MSSRLKHLLGVKARKMPKWESWQGQMSIYSRGIKVSVFKEESSYYPNGPWVVSGAVLDIKREGGSRGFNHCKTYLGRFASLEEAKREVEEWLEELETM
jgi:hypothetical protein